MERTSELGHILRLVLSAAGQPTTKAAPERSAFPLERQHGGAKASGDRRRWDQGGLVIPVLGDVQPVEVSAAMRSHIRRASRDQLYGLLIEVLCRLSDTR